MSSADRPPRTPRMTGLLVQGHLFEKPSPLLTIGQVEALFCDRLGIAHSTFYESFRDQLPFVYTRTRREGKALVQSRPRLREDVAQGLIQIAENGLWGEYVTGALLDAYPKLYPLEDRVRRAA